SPLEILAVLEQDPAGGTVSERELGRANAVRRRRREVDLEDMRVRHAVRAHDPELDPARAVPGDVTGRVRSRRNEARHAGIGPDRDGVDGENQAAEGSARDGDG